MQVTCVTLNKGMDIKIMIRYLTGVLHVQKSASAFMEKTDMVLQWDYKSERYMCVLILKLERGLVWQCDGSLMKV